MPANLRSVLGERIGAAGVLFVGADAGTNGQPRPERRPIGLGWWRTAGKAVEAREDVLVFNNPRVQVNIAI